MTQVRGGNDALLRIEAEIARSMRALSEDGEIDIDSEFRAILEDSKTLSNSDRGQLAEISHAVGDDVLRDLGLAAADGGCSVEIIDDGQAAMLSIVPPTLGGRAVGMEDARSELKRLGIVFGIDEEVLSKAVSTGARESVRGAPIAIATPATPGVDDVLDVLGRVDPGVHVIIGAATYTVPHAMNRVRFRYDPAESRIVASPLS